MNFAKTGELSLFRVYDVLRPLFAGQTPARRSFELTDGRTPISASSSRNSFSAGAESSSGGGGGGGGGGGAGGTAATNSGSRRASANWFTPFLDPSRDSTLLSVQRQIKARDGILDSYRRVKQAMKHLQDGYVASKDTVNVLHRYSDMKRMIRQVISLEKNYWILIDLPKQELSESQADFLTRILNAMEQRLQNASPAPAKPGGISSLLGTTAHLADRAKDASLIEQLKSKSTDDLKKESAQLQTYLYKLIKKYAGLRALVSQLKREYDASKGYPVIPRYSMLKKMIKDVLRARAFVEVCHEVDTV